MKIKELYQNGFSFSIHGSIFNFRNKLGIFEYIIAICQDKWFIGSHILQKVVLVQACSVFGSVVKHEHISLALNKQKNN